MHEPVLVDEVLELLDPQPGGTFIDGTLGGGGHAEAVLRRIGGDGFLLGIDRDAEAIERSRGRLGVGDATCAWVHGNFSELGDIVRARGIREVDGILLDVGVSSNQLDDPERGLSFMADGPLDMRMDRSQGETAEAIVNGLSEARLAEVLWEYGEERKSRRIAAAIVRAREEDPIRTTRQLADIVEKAMGGRRGRQHPATRTFQAIRIAVNNELDALERGLSAALEVLAVGGRLAVISFHSLEDRRVKNFFRAHRGRWESLPEGGREWVGQFPRVETVTRKPVCPGRDEVQRNPRSRSAKLRVAERVTDIVESDG